MPKLTSELFALKRVLVFITHKARLEARLVGPQPVSVSLRVPSQSIFSGPSHPALLCASSRWFTSFSSLLPQSLKSDEDAESAKEPQNELFEAQGNL